MNGNSNPPGKPPSAAHDRHHAAKRRARRDAARTARAAAGDEQTDDGRIYLYGLHTVRHALANPARRALALHATPNGLARLEKEIEIDPGLARFEAQPRALEALAGYGAVHQGVVLEAEPLTPKSLDDLGNANLLLVLDQVTDPHNVGAVLRSAAAFDAGGLVTTARHSPGETAVLAKAASGALDVVPMALVRNLAAALDDLAGMGFAVIGLDSEGGDALEAVADATARTNGRIALVLGAEGRGLRAKTREHCQALARLDMPGAIKSLNVSNAAALALYLARRALQVQDGGATD